MLALSASPVSVPGRRRRAALVPCRAASDGASGAPAASPLVACPSDLDGVWALLQDFTKRDVKRLERVLWTPTASAPHETHPPPTRPGPGPDLTLVVACRSQPVLQSAASRDHLRAALLRAAFEPHPPVGWAPLPPGAPGGAVDPASAVILGLLASDARLAARALRDWADAFGLPPPPPVDGLAALRGPVYIKYRPHAGGGASAGNPRGAAASAAPLSSPDRGVLVQLGGIQTGHFPLGLWDEGKEREAPTGLGG